LANPGLEPSEISSAASYFHFREGFEPSAKTLAERENTFDDSIDIFATIDEDQPKGSNSNPGVWSIQAAENVALVRNLQWPGYTFVHSTNPVSYSSLYYGNGQKNHNVGFML
jgi:radial spoke head protein 9